MAGLEGGWGVPLTLPMHLRKSLRAKLPGITLPGSTKTTFMSGVAEVNSALLGWKGKGERVLCR